jgi:hypothetical protein
MITDDSSTKLAYQSNKDETYFRARLALMIKPAISALLARKNSIPEMIRREMLPVMTDMHELLNGGVSINVDTSDLEDNQLIESINKSRAFNFFRPMYRNKICSSCGTKVSMYSEVCKSCGFTNYSNITIPNQ